MSKEFPRQRSQGKKSLFHEGRAISHTHSHFGLPCFYILKGQSRHPQVAAKLPSLPPWPTKSEHEGEKYSINTATNIM